MLERLASYTAILATLLVAMLLDVYPLDIDYRIFRPQFTLLVVVYWIFVLPQSTSMSLLIILGLVHDVLVGAPLGQHPLVYVVVTYLCLRSYRRMRHFALWQEALWVFTLVLIAQLVAYWVQSLGGRELAGPDFVLPALASATVWPLIALLLDRVRRGYRIARQV